MNLLSSLRYLIALSEHRHFGRAAAASHITQPALSNALRALEAEFGVTIVHRGRTFVGFTPEGERVLLAARNLLRERDLLTQDLLNRTDEPQGALSIAAVPSALPVAARFVALLKRQHPGIMPTLRSLSSPDIDLGLQQLTVDLALGYSDRERTGRRAESRRSSATGDRLVLPQYGERYYLVSRAQKARVAGLRIGEPIGWRDAAQRPLCLLTPEMHNRTIVDGAFAQAGSPVQPAMQTNSIIALALAVAEGDVCAVMPGAVLSAVRSYSNLQAQPLVRPEIETAIGFMSQRHARTSRALEAALEFALRPDWLRHVQRHSGWLSER